MVTSLKLLRRRSEVVVTFIFPYLERRRMAMTMPASLGMKGDRVMVTLASLICKALPSIFWEKRE